MIRQRPVGRLLSRYLWSCEVEVERVGHTKEKHVSYTIGF